MSEPCSCGTGCACGCCAGTEPLTPTPVANRPGLDALSYRIGTHSTFLETMKARLSSRVFPALAGLTTREANDPSIALLDAWAMVADVLTFYQERIANEGYLRTATERLSVLELARLVGYALRPGVAASIHLAYTLDEGPETVIPAGAAARSVPGPGEMPQTFETSDDLTARAAWNVLQVRRTAPQQVDSFAAAGNGDLPLYLKGIATQLRPNDPLLIETGSAAPPALFRVLAVVPDPANDRTEVKVRLWVPPEIPQSTGVVAAPVPPPLPSAAPDLVSGMGGAVELEGELRRESELEALGIARGAIARRVLGALEPVRRALAARTEGGLADALVGALAKLRAEHEIAVERNANRLEPWIAGLIGRLEREAAGGGTTAPSTVLAPQPALRQPLESDRPPADPHGELLAGGTFELASSSGAGSEGEGIPSIDTTPETTEIGKILGSLGKPPAPQPRNSANLNRNLGRLFNSGSDLSTHLLTVARPELANVLYPSWANLPATVAPALKVCALRTRASVFGFNAPLEPVRNDAGIVVGSKEWDLLQGAATGGETFRVTVRPFRTSQAFAFAVGIGAAVGSSTLSEQVFSSPQADARFSVPFPGGQETLSIHFVAVPPPQNGLPFEVECSFKRRGVRIAVRGSADPKNQTERIEASCSLPATVAAKFVDETGVNTVSPVVAETPGFSDLSPFFFPVGHFESIEVSGTIPAFRLDDLALYLDNSYPQIRPDSWIVLERPDRNLNDSPLVLARVRTVKDVSRAIYGLTGRSTCVGLDRPWLRLDSESPDSFAVIRGTSVFAQCEELPLAEAPLPDEVCGGAIELEGLYDGLQPGRWLIFSGIRADIGEVDAAGKVVVPVGGVPGAELAMLASVDQGIRAGHEGDLPGERVHTAVTLAKPLAYCYRRDTLKIYGNVVHATQGESRFEVLGSGDASSSRQSFTLKQPPLTWVSAPTPSGIESTLQVRVNDLLWHRADCPAGLRPADRSYLLRIDDGGQTTIVVGDGQRGARLPSGAENVRARYRSGLGREGNVKAGQVSQLATRPLGVKEVVNPLPASGGAGPESRDQARRNAPLAVLALDRLVSLQDHADFARTFAGVGKSSATRISNGRNELVHVTVAGEDDIPIAADSDLLRNLEVALLRFGDPRQRLALAVRQRFFLVVQADVRLLPDFLWEKVEAGIRAALLQAFGFSRRDLGQAALLSEVYRAAQGVPGVDFVDVNLFAAADPEDLQALPAILAQRSHPSYRLPARLPAHLARVAGGKIRPAQLLYLTPEAADTLILKERKS